MTTSSSSATIAESLESQSAADVVDASDGTSDAVLPELTKSAVKSEQRKQTLTAAVNDVTSTPIKYDKITEAISSTLLLGKIGSTVSDPTIATVLVSTVATTLTSKDTSTTESNVPTALKQNVYTDGISSTFGSDITTTPAPISEVEAAKIFDHTYSNIESTTVPDSALLPHNAATKSEVTDIVTTLPPKGDNALTGEVSSALKSSIDMALTSNSTSALMTKTRTPVTSGARSSLKSEFQTTPSSDFLTGLTSDTETLPSTDVATAALPLTSSLTSEGDSSSVAFTLHSQNESSIHQDASTSGITIHEISSAVPATTDQTSLGAELGTTTLVSPSSTGRTTKPVRLSSRLSTGSTKAVEETSATVVPTKHRTTSNVRSSLATSLPIQKAKTSQVSTSLSYTVSTKISGQHDLSSLATTDRMKEYETSVFGSFNSTLNGTAIVDSDPGINVALAVSLSLVFGLTLILVVSVLVYCLLRSYCHQFHRCCSKRTGHCKLCSYSCVENRHYHGLQQRLTETPDLISESVHAQITRIARGSSHPDQIALLERSLDDQHSLNELDQLVFEDPDLVSPTSDLFIDCRLASVSSAYDCCSPENECFHESADDRCGRNSASAGRPRNHPEGACYSSPGSGMYACAREPRAETSGCDRWHAATRAENPYLRPSCHAHVEPGPNWRPFHPYDQVYVPHHDPIGMQRRLEGTYVTSPRLRMKQRNLYEEVRVNADTQRLMPVSPPIVPSRLTGTDSINVPVAPVRVSSRPSPVVPKRGASRGSVTPVAPVRVSSRSSPIVHTRGTIIDRNASAQTPKPPARVSSRSSPVPHHRGAAMDHAGPSSPVMPLKARSRSPPTTSNRVLMLSSINATAKGPSRPAGEISLLDRSLPKLPVSENSPEPSVSCFSGGQRDSTSSSATIPGHEYSRVDFGSAQQGPAPIVTTAEVEPYETDSDSCRDGAYESIDFPKNPPSS